MSTRKEGLIVTEVMFCDPTGHGRGHFELFFTDGSSRSYELPVESLFNASMRAKLRLMDDEMASVHEQSMQSSEFDIPENEAGLDENGFPY